MSGPVPEQSALPKEAVAEALALLETLRPACEGKPQLVVQLALAVRLAEVLTSQAPTAGEDDQRTVLFGVLLFIGYVVQSYQDLTGHQLPPFSLGLVSKGMGAAVQGLEVGRVTVH